MTIKRLIFRGIIRCAERINQQLPIRSAMNIDLRDSQSELDLMTIAFNNVETLRYQYRFLKKNILDSFTYIVIDNSTKESIRQEISDFCKQNNISYISLPQNLLNVMGSSYSHAMALNYTWHHVISVRKPRSFGFIDHDLFPIMPIKIGDYILSQPIYGPLRLRGNCWYLSGIMSFFSFDYVRSHSGLDFMPVTPEDCYLDTGGGNWYKFYHLLDKETLVFPSECIEALREGADRHGDSLEYFDNNRWLHTINGSCWKKINEGKESLVNSILNNLLSC